MKRVAHLLLRAQRRLSTAIAPWREVIVERIAVPPGAITGLRLPLDVIRTADPQRTVALVWRWRDPDDYRCGWVALPDRERRDHVDLAFDALEAVDGETLALVVLEPRRRHQSLEGAATWGRRFVPVLARRAPITLPASAIPSAASLKRRDLMVVPPGSNGSDVPLALNVEAAWGDLRGIYVRGWVHAFEANIRNVSCRLGDIEVHVNDLHQRPDVAEVFPHCPNALRSGFEVYIPSRCSVDPVLSVETDVGTAQALLDLPARTDDGAGDGLPPEDEDEAFGRFLHELLEPSSTGGLDRSGLILEIGARRLAPHAIDRRRQLEGVGRVIGFDIHPAPPVDVVGDVHTLSTIFRHGSFDAAFSEVVLEHLAAPWLVAAEINRVLRVGGLAFHTVPAAWPVHEMPNDFWRFTNEGLRELFGPATGFEVLESAMSHEVQMVPFPSWRHGRYFDLPLNRAFAFAHILARKVRDLHEDEVRWPRVGLESRSTRYPNASA